MAGIAGSVSRLTAVAWTLARHDALAPREIVDLLPLPLRPVAFVARLFVGSQGRSGRPGERLARALERLGPVAVKLGQILSTRADIFGVVFAEDLSRLKDRLPPFPTEDARRDIAAALGRPPESLFAELGEPVAAASLAQAHRAVLLDGREAAVKVLRPGVERQVARDVDAMNFAASVIEALVPAARRLEPKAFVATVARSLQLELDLRMEAAAASELGEIMGRDPYMSAPAVVWEGVGKRVLTLEWASGVPLSDSAALEQAGLDRKGLADGLIRAFLAQALDHGTFHADLHEGNLFCAPPAKLTAVDFGIVGRIGESERRYLAEILWGFLRRDYRRVAEVHFDAGYVPKVHSVDAFAQALRAVAEPAVGRPATEISMGRMLQQLFEVTALFDMKLRPELVLLQKTMVTVEGVARGIYPDHDIWEAARPVVERWIARELSPPAQAVRAIRALVETLNAIAAAAAAPTPAAPPAGRKADLVAVAALVLATAALALAASTFL